jgi:hypothetical protein
VVIVPAGVLAEAFVATVGEMAVEVAVAIVAAPSPWVPVVVNGPLAPLPATWHQGWKREGPAFFAWLNSSDVDQSAGEWIKPP